MHNPVNKCTRWSEGKRVESEGVDRKIGKGMKLIPETDEEVSVTLLVRNAFVSPRLAGVVGIPG